jgi:hypothetical protein
MLQRYMWIFGEFMLGVLVAGVIAPLTLVVLPPHLQGPPALIVLALACGIAVPVGRTCIGRRAAARRSR